jgi:pimeloyl-ACP methyl ester carboxylesterase
MCRFRGSAIGITSSNILRSGTSISEGPMWNAWSRGANASYLIAFTMNCLQPHPALQTRDHYAALYARPGAIHDAFSGQYAAFAQDAIDNQKLVAQGKLTLPVLAIGGDHSYGAHLATEIGFAASNVRSAIINNSGHWIMEEQPQQAIAIIVPFLEEKK